METQEIAFFAEYQCPHCQASLENHAGPATPWVRCPRCARASRPPIVSERPVPPPPVISGEEVLFIAAPPDLNPMTPVGIAGPQREVRPGSPWRVAFAAALFVSVVLLLFAFLDGNNNGATIFATSAVVSLALLIRSAWS